MKMSQTEQMIWAAVFAKEYDLSNPPGRLARPGNEAAREQWQEARVLHAMELAGYAVGYARDLRAQFIEDWEGLEVAAMVEQMIQSGDEDE